MKRALQMLSGCRWRDSFAADQHQCRSPKFLRAPNVVSSATCGACGCVDHAPPPPLPRPLPCVHLGEWTGKSVKLRDGGEHDVFACALHGRCAADSAEPTLPGKVRCCTPCPDYLARDPFGPSSGQMRRRADALLADLGAYPVKRYHGRGIVIAGGGDRYLASLYVTIRAIRHVGCTLPIQVWYLGRNREMPRARQALFARWDVEFIDADKVRRTHPARQLNGWELKVFATLHSPFEEVLFLDADCYPCRNPDFLFDFAEYQAKGAIFWPDWMLEDERLKWSAFGLVDPDRPGTVESGQYVINKRTCWRALNLTWFYNDHSDYYYRYGYGDKHTFEAAWTAVEQPFVMFGPLSHIDLAGYIHIGPDKEPLFVHRCSDKFRLATQDYITAQRNVVPKFYPQTPLETECWGWLGELAETLGVVMIDR